MDESGSGSGESQRFHLYSELRGAVASLPASVREWIDRSLRSGWYEIGSHSFQAPGGTLCPIAAAATMAGIWHDGALKDGNPDWGTPDAPSAAVEDFAAYFDICAEDDGLGRAIELVRLALEESLTSQSRVA